MRNLTFIAAELLTYDHDAVADFLLPLPNEHPITEEIET